MIQSVSTTVHEAGAAQATRKPNDSLGKEAFLTMLVAQLRHQDPLSPMNGDEMAAQLAQFSSLEQLTEIRDALVGQADAQAAMLAMANGTAAMGLLGRTVVTDIPHMQVEDGSATPIEIDVSGVGGSGTLRLYDSAGREVKLMELGHLAGGRQSIDLSSAIEGLPDGAYTFAVEVLDANGQAIATEPITTMRVDGVRYGAEGPVLTAGDVVIPVGRVVGVVD